MDSITTSCKNPKCKNELRIRIVEDAKKKNYYGWWIVRCNRCKEIFDINVGKDVYDSLLISGGTILQRLDTEKTDETQVPIIVQQSKAKFQG
jgi:hypothetical protein